MAHSAGLLSSLPHRPPTPPKELTEGIDDALSFLDVNSVIGEYRHPLSVVPNPPLETPPRTSPSSSAENTDTPKRKKRVSFTPCLLHKRRTSAGFVFEPSTPKRSARAVRSILKPHERKTSPASSNGNSSVDASPRKEITKTFAEMLESVVQQLAGKDHYSRLDAYTTVLGALRACEAVPDPEALKIKLSLLCQFIRRDVLSCSDTSDVQASNLAAQALRLLGALLLKPGVEAELETDFCAWFIDRTISTLKDGDKPKSVVLQHMLVFTEQKFGSKVMTTDRVEQILDTLDNIHERVKGSSVLKLRLQMYNQLLEHSRSVMVLKTATWLPLVFQSMLANIKEIREQAIYVGFQASLALGDSPVASTALLNMLSGASDGRGLSAGQIAAKLYAMLDTKDANTSVYVPQIWSTVILFLRSRKREVEQWTCFKQWLQVIQRCFNSSDPKVRVQANLAWNRLIYSVDVNEVTGPSMIKMLKQPIFSQLQRTSADKQARKMKHSALSSYYCLLYYALRPSASTTQLKLYWEEYVAQILDKTAKQSPDDFAAACNILSSLLDTTKSQQWRQERVVDFAAGNLSVDELPTLSPTWVRKNIKTILELMEPWLIPMGPLADHKKAVMSMWTNLMSSIVEAGRKEIKPSVEYKEAIAQIMNMFHRLWYSSAHEGGSFIQSFDCLVQPVIRGPGSIHFTEQILVQSSGEDHFEIAVTPSSRHSSSSDGRLQSPLGHLLELASSPVLDDFADAKYLDIIESWLASCAEKRSTRSGGLELLRSCLQLAPKNSAQSLHSRFAAEVWPRVADLAESYLGQDVANDSSQLLGHGYRACIEILASSFSIAAVNFAEKGSRLLAKLMETVTKEAGEGGLVLAVMEPMAEVIAKFLDHGTLEPCLSAATEILRNAVFPSSRQSLDRGRKALWGVTETKHKSFDFDPYTHVYTMVNDMLQRLYNLETTTSLNTDAFLTAVGGFVSKAPVTLKAVVLRKLQSSLTLWVGDSENSLREGASRGLLRKPVQNLWARTTQSIQCIPRKDSTLLKALAPLITAGLRSKRGSIVNATIDMWNTSFGLQQSLDYPEEVQQALRRLRPFVDLELPTFPNVGGGDAEVARLSASFPQDDQNSVLATTAQIAHPPKLPSKKLFSSSPSLKPPKAHDRRVSPSSGERTPKAKLRHNDSQIQFTAVRSSFSPEAEDAPSQLLTERQKEVRSRQAGEHRLFREVQSSPVRRMTPIVSSPISKPDDDVPGSSPSSGSVSTRRRSRSERNGDGGPPSSPSSMALASPVAARAQLQPEALDSTDLHQHLEKSPKVALGQLNDACSLPGSDQMTTGPPLTGTDNVVQEKLQHEAAGTTNDDRGEPINDQIQDISVVEESFVNAPWEASEDNKIHEKPSSSQELDSLSPCSASQPAGNSTPKLSPEKLNFPQKAPSATPSETKVSSKKRGATDVLYGKAGKRHKAATVEDSPSLEILRCAFVAQVSQVDDDSDNCGDCIVVTPRESSQTSHIQASTKRRSRATKSSLSRDSSQLSQPSSAVESPITIRKRRRVSHQEPDSAGLFAKRSRGSHDQTEASAVGRYALRSDSTIPKAGPSVRRILSHVEIPATDCKPIASRNETSGVRQPASMDSNVAGSSQHLVSAHNRRPLPDRVSNGSTTMSPEAAAAAADAKNPQQMQSSQSHCTSKVTQSPSPARSPSSGVASGILSRLKGLLFECRDMILGSKEERQFDDVLFEFRMEVHEAGRRGREQA